MGTSGIWLHQAAQQLVQVVFVCVLVRVKEMKTIAQAGPLYLTTVRHSHPITSSPHPLS